MSSAARGPIRHQDGRAARRARRSLLRNQRAAPPNGPDSVQQQQSPADEAGLGTRQQDEDAAPADSQDAEVVDDDDTCPICQLLLYNPVTTTCNHTLCNHCMATWASVSLQAPMVVVDVDDEPVAFDPVSDLEARCPMCRTLTSARPDAARTAALRNRYPQTWAERQSEAEADGQDGGDDDAGSIQTMTVYIGNRHQAVEAYDDDPAGNQHEWTFFVRPSRTDIIEEVHMHLHPTFRQSHVVRQRAPYQITRRGWGAFTLTAGVILKAGYAWVSDDARDSPDGAAKGMLPLEWTLDFDGYGGRGSMGRCRLKVRNDRGWREASHEEERDNREWGRMVRQYERDGRYEPS